MGVRFTSPLRAPMKLSGWTAPTAQLPGARRRRASWLAATGVGTRGPWLFEVCELPRSGGEPGDVLAPSLTDRPGKFRRLPLRGRPLPVAFMATQEKVVIANYLQDALRVVDCE